MPLTSPFGALPAEADVQALMNRLYPICRSITGDGVRETLAILAGYANLQVHEVASGTIAYDWTVPDEWNIRDAFIADMNGKRLVDFRASNLHIVSYSIPINQTLTFAELDQHLHSLPSQPDAIPYRTAYYSSTWGFAITQRQRDAFDRNATYRVVIDSTKAPGSLSYGERLLSDGDGPEYLISTYSCHPSLGNDNLSGLILWTFLLARMAHRPLRNRYRFIVVPETIGSVIYMARNEAAMTGVAGGFVVTCVAGPGEHGYKSSFAGHSLVDRAARKALTDAGINWEEFPFDAGGSDERNYSAPFFRIPTGTISKSKYYTYDEYHTSLDNLTFISARELISTLALYESTIHILECERPLNSRMPYCEPMLGKRGLYPEIGGSQRSAAEASPAEQLDAIRWVMHMADGQETPLSIAMRSGLPHTTINKAVDTLIDAGLIVPGTPDPEPGRASRSGRPS